MLGKGVSKEHFQPRTCSGKNTPRTGQVKENLKNVVYIDVESDQVDDVVIIDYPEFVSQKLHGSSGPSRDRTWTPQSVISIDDDDDDESDGVYNPGIDAEGVGELDSDASSSKKFSSASGRKRNSVHIDVDDCDVYKKDSVSSMQKGKEASVSNMQKSKEAYSAKASDRNRYGLYDSDSETSDSDCSDCELMEREQWETWEKASAKRKHGEGPVFSGPSNRKYVKENPSSFTVKDDTQMDGFLFNLGTDNSFKNSGQNVEQENFKSPRSESKEEMYSFRRSSDIEQGEKTSRLQVSPCPNSKNCNFCNGVTSASRLKKELGGEESKFMGSCQDARDSQVDDVGSAMRSKDENLSQVNSNRASSDERHINGDGFGLHMSSCQDARDSQVDDNGSALRSKDENLSQVNSNRASSDERHVNGDGFGLHTQDGGFTASKEGDIINEREKIKETDEYKQAMEEEWASRQRQMQIQAEEAQKLRKRKKAESKRLLDMERRQKERIEEVRETQKKDEEFINMKDQLRVELLKGLKELEMRCSDMTSLLRGLGIHVGGPSEVRAAYKRALLKFHPDRASKTDIREQVEAEEKFKLISRMNKKFLT